MIGTPAGGYKDGAFEIFNTDHTKDSINELNFILGKLVPAAPDTVNGLTLSLTGTAGNGRLCQGFSPTNNTSGALTPTAGTQYTRNTDSTITSNYIDDIGPGDNGTVEGFVNGVTEPKEITGDPTVLGSSYQKTSLDDAAPCVICPLLNPSGEAALINLTS